MTEQELRDLIWYGQGDSAPERALQWLNKTLESQVEYETEHKDSGSNYAQIVMESWRYHNIDDAIWSYCLNNPELFGSMVGLEKDVLGREVCDRFDMRPYWSGWHAFAPGDGLCLLQVPVSELELQISEYEAAQAGFEWLDVLDASLFASDYALGRNGGGDLLFYACPNTSWCAVISDAKLIDILTDLRECEA